MSKFDLTRYMDSPEDYAHIDVRGESMKKAVAMIALQNEKTAEQVVILKQQEAIDALQGQIVQLQQLKEKLNNE